MRLLALALALGLASPAAAEELSPLMLRLQIHMDKIYWAGKAQSWALAGFYAQKLGETLALVEKGKFTRKGVDVSTLASPMLKPSLASVEKAIEAKAGFEGAYTAMVGACNGCHAAAQHPFIQITVPTRPIFDNQKFTP